MPLQRLPHIVLTATPDQESFQRRGGGGEERPLPQRNRAAHARRLLTELQALQEDARRRAEEVPVASVVGTKSGLHVQFELEAGHSEALKSLEDRRKKIEIVATRAVEDKILATVYVPRGQLSTFEHKIQKYATTDTPRGRPAHERLIAPVSAIRLAVLRDFWTDDDAAFPATNVIARWGNTITGVVPAPPRRWPSAVAGRRRHPYAPPCHAAVRAGAHSLSVEAGRTIPC